MKSGTIVFFEEHPNGVMFNILESVITEGRSRQSTETLTVVKRVRKIAESDC
jgi:hypothetical protein